MLGGTEPTRWEIIQAAIEKSKEGPDGIAMNLAVAKALHDFCRENEVASYAKPTLKWNVGYGHSVRFWNDFYSLWEAQALSCISIRA